MEKPPETTDVAAFFRRHGVLIAAEMILAPLAAVSLFILDQFVLGLVLAAAFLVIAVVFAVRVAGDVAQSSAK